MGFFDSKSKSSSTARNTDTAENFAEASAGNLLNLNLAGSNIGPQGKGSRVVLNSSGGRGQLGSGGKAGSIGKGGITNTGVLTQVTTLDGGAIERAFEFAQKISSGAQESGDRYFSQALQVASEANTNAKSTPVDEQVKIGLIVGGALAALVIMQKAMK
jgi:hypothetical protein